MAGNGTGGGGSGGATRRRIAGACVFSTGAVTIALELIASRILTPYVGGSLYVWTAILSVTLLALAAGYALGGRWSRTGDAGALFSRVPALAAILLCAIAALYPLVLPGLAYRDALAGAFAGSLLILGPALVLLSAMGPLAIALTARAEGDRGAGTIFAVSTVGSVTGAPLAAFILLPVMAPATALVVLAGGLAVVSAVALAVARDRLTTAALLPASALAIGATALVVGRPPATADIGPYTAHHVETARSPHGAIVVVDVTHDRRDGAVRLYLADNQIQSARAESLPGEPLRYVAIVSALIDRLAPPDGRVLVLGLAGGTIATDLAAGGRVVEAAEINPQAVAVAVRHFGFDPAAVPVAVADARRVLARCVQRYDVILFDTFSGLTVPDHLVTREAFAAAGRCLAPGGAVVVNAIVPAEDSHATRRLLAAVAEGVGGRVTLYADPAAGNGPGNRVIVADRAERAPLPLVFRDYPTDLFHRAPRTVEPRPVTADLLDGAAPLTDASNDFALTMAGAALRLGHFPIPATWH